MVQICSPHAFHSRKTLQETLGKLFEGLGKPMSNQELTRIVDEADVDHDARQHLVEWLTWLTWLIAMLINVCWFMLSSIYIYIYLWYISIYLYIYITYLVFFSPKFVLKDPSTGKHCPNCNVPTHVAIQRGIPGMSPITARASLPFGSHSHVKCWLFTHTSGKILYLIVSKNTSFFRMQLSTTPVLDMFLPHFF